METLRNRTWVTREGVYADRIAGAWLIRRFIDPEAHFKFANGQTLPTAGKRAAFRHLEAEFTHEGDKIVANWHRLLSHWTMMGANWPTNTDHALTSCSPGSFI